MTVRSRTGEGDGSGITGVFPYLTWGTERGRYQREVGIKSPWGRYLGERTGVFKIKGLRWWEQ